MKAGWTLISMIIALVITAGASLLLLHLVWIFFFQLSRSYTAVNTLFESVVATELFKRDVHGLQHRAKKQQRDAFIFSHHLDQTDCGWIIDEHGLVRIEGVYSKGTWKKKTKSLAARSIDKVTYRYFYKKERLVAIQAFFEGAHKLDVVTALKSERIV